MNAFAVYLSDGRHVRLEDPNGGTFDAAGGFPTSLSETPMLRSHDPLEDTVIDGAAAQALLPEIEWLLRYVGDTNFSPYEQARPGVARRGLLRLRALVHYCAKQPGSYLVCFGNDEDWR